MSDMPRYRFGLYEFDPARLELRREGVLVRLQAQPARMLAVLIEHADQIVTRDELRKAVWDDDTFVEFESGLNFCVSQLRAALQDASAQPRFVRTIPKKGYQFIAPVQRLDADALENAVRAEGAGARTQVGRRIVLALGLAGLAALAVLGLRFRSIQSERQGPILAVARFDNETGDAALGQFSDALTDEVVAQLTLRSNGAYRVIGNAQILRLPREQRDLKAIAARLNAGYVVLGQVQGSDKQLRVLAHLIRLSDQTHIWVTRADGVLDEPLKLESDVAGKIGAQFASKMAADPSRAASFPSASH